MKLSVESEELLMNIATDKNVYLEGSILKVLEPQAEVFGAYIAAAKEKDAESRRKRLEVTKQVQEQNKHLQEAAQENQALMDELKVALSIAETAREEALSDLSVMQQKTQFELIGDIVTIALYVIVGVGVVVTGMYLYSMSTLSPETTLIGNTWSNLFGILLTNSFSIIGTIMGVKYAGSSKENKDG